MEKAKFGYRSINSKEKPIRVNQVFTSVSDKYDLMNDIMSLGLHRLWKKQFLRACNLNIRKDVLDVACGTGDLSLAIKQYRSDINLTCLDPNSEMIAVCKQSLINKGFSDVNFKVSSMETFKDKKQKYDLITIAFGFRNFTDHRKSLNNIYELLVPGGSLLIMDFKTPRNKLYSKLFKFYTLNIIPRLGSLIANDAESYRYLGESIQTYFTPHEISNMCIESGFSDINVINLLEDVATIHIAHKV